MKFDGLIFIEFVSICRLIALMKLIKQMILAEIGYPSPKIQKYQENYIINYGQQQQLQPTYKITDGRLTTPIKRGQEQEQISHKILYGPVIISQPRLVFQPREIYRNKRKIVGGIMNFIGLILWIEKTLLIGILLYKIAGGEKQQRRAAYKIAGGEQQPQLSSGGQQQIIYIINCGKEMVFQEIYILGYFNNLVDKLIDNGDEGTLFIMKPALRDEDAEEEQKSALKGEEILEEEAAWEEEKAAFVEDDFDKLIYGYLLLLDGP
eukprot:293456_1